MTRSSQRPERKQLLTVREAAAYLGLPITILYRRLAEGRVPGATKIGDTWYVRRPAADAWLRGEGGYGQS